MFNNRNMNGPHFNQLRTFTAAVWILMILPVIAPAQSDTTKSAVRAWEEKDVERHFAKPPHEAGIRAFWWWLNGNVTKEAITRDLVEMKDKGYNGALIFDADGSAQTGHHRVPAGPVFGSPAWTELFVHACKEAERLNLELSLNIQSGWNLGGPNVPPELAAQQLTWTKVRVNGPQRIHRKLETPPGHRGFYRDITVIAVPVTDAPPSERFVLEASSSQPNFPAARAMDGDSNTFWVSENQPREDKPEWLLLTLPEPKEISRLIIQGRPGYGPRDCDVEVSSDGRTFQTVKKISLADGESLTTDIEPQRASFVRILFTGAYDRGRRDSQARNVQVAEIRVLGGGEEFQPRPIRHLSEKSATREIGGSAPDSRYLLFDVEPVAGEKGVPSNDVIDLSGEMDTAGVLQWEAPEGQWEILRFGHTATGAHVSTHTQGWDGLVLDYLNPEALRDYWNRNIEALWEAIGPMAGTTLRYVHTDSWEGGGMNWTPGFDTSFKTRRGYDLLPWLPVVAGHMIESREASNAFLADLRKTIGDLVADHYEELARLAARHGMATHPESAGPHAGPLDGLKNYGRSELMMSEFWSPSPHRPHPPNRFFVKQASSAAHTYGKRLVGAEAFTTIGPHWNDVPWSQMKPSFDHEFCEGLNLVFHHTFTCSPKEMGIPGQEYFAGTHFNPQITWWEETPAFIDYMRRCQYMAQQGEFVADVLYYYGDHIPNIARRKADDPAGALPGFDYDVLSEELLLESLTVEDGRLSLPSGMKYRVLVLPDHRVLSLGALKKVHALVNDGATVLGPKPERAVSLEGGAEGVVLFTKLAADLWGAASPGEGQKGSRNVGSGRIVWGNTAREFLLSDGVAQDVAFQDESSHATMSWIHYRIDDAEVYFLSEQTGGRTPVDAIFRVDGRIPELWNPVDGSIREANRFRLNDGRTHVPLEMGPFGSIFVVFRKPATEGRDDGPNFAEWKEHRMLGGPWEVAFDPKWGGPEEPVRFDALTSWTDRDEPGIKYYSGRARYRKTFQIDENDFTKDTRLAIELGEVKDLGIARVILNGRDLGVVWIPPFRVTITDEVRTGKNVLEVEVVNSWRNRLIRDHDLPKSERLTNTNIVVKNWALEESGLLGPVRLVTR